MELEESINYTFTNKKLMEIALTHKSYANDHKMKDYEKLEFLGDSILEFVTSEYMYFNYPHLREGELTKVRSQTVCEDSLYEVAKRHNIFEHVRVASGDYLEHSNAVKSISADVVESLIAAIYFDGGMENAKKFILDNLEDTIKDAGKNVGQKDYKTVLQETIQKSPDIKIQYKVIKESGPDHDKTFVSEVSINGKAIATGEGKTKKEAEMQAAKKALNMEGKNK